ncbi:amino acid ABC transporter substrate-binding protein [Paucibacter sp. B2R-40]|uniref:amino acid ABC transporter substrate-binding protein n=1 Tax=Paucibacter sp. B2R-40 TaxID=2893554 RepID=UPI0021E3CDCB|nr:amino acid ABC transporter substrate-binding protein [Paucibacter sp. B2R-40]MCV2353347.1 amino acid ABC transporter substrate-binding protein [Paucibacter sp. B2R-40]
MVKTILAALLITASAIGATASAQVGGQGSPNGGPNTLGKIKAAKTINVAYSADSLPFSFTGPDKAPLGFSIDLCKRVIAQIGRTVGEPNLTVNWMAGSVSERLQMVATGRADLDCANTTQTQSRLAHVDFSNLIFIDGGGLLVKSGSTINQVSDLAGKKIAVLKGTTTEARLAEVLRLRLVNAGLVPVNDAAAGLAMLEAGTVDALASDKVKLVGLAIQAKEPAKLALVAEDFSIEPYALALPRNDSALRLEVNKALTQVYAGGDIESIFAQWLGKLGRPTGLLSAMFLLNSIPE